MLASLAQSDLRRLAADMQATELRLSQVLFEPDQPIQHVYFPLSGIISLVVVGGDGADLDVATIGNEGTAGLGGLLAGDVSFTRQMVRVAGQAVRISRAPFLLAVDESRHMRELLAAHADAFTAQLLQSIACATLHSVEQRLARWLLTIADRSGQRGIPFTHKAIAELLGVQRPTVTLAARMMQKSGLIDSRRGLITITGRPGLRRIACECYPIIRETYDTALGGT